MAAPLRVEQRLNTLEERMTALERLPDRMDRLERAIATLSARIEDSRRETRVLHEDAIARFALLGEGLAANSQALAGLSAEMRTMFDTVNSRLTTIENRLPVARRRKD